MQKEKKMSLTWEQLVSIYEQYNLYYEKEELNGEIDGLRSALFPLKKNIVFEIEGGERFVPSESRALKKRIEEIVKRVVELGGGRIEIKHYETKIGLDEGNTEVVLNVSFADNHNQVKWRIETEQGLMGYYEYSDVFAWASTALGKGYHEESMDYFSAWYLPPLALKEIKRKLNEPGKVIRPTYSSKRSRIMYIEMEGSKDRAAIVGRVSISKTGKTLYYDEMIFQEDVASTNHWNYVEANSNEKYWICDIKKDNNKAHLHRETKINVDLDCQFEYQIILEGKHI